MKEHNEIDLLFQSALSGLELTPDLSVKKNIDRAITAKKKRRRFLFILFPLLFGITSFAAILPFIQNENTAALSELRDVNEKQHADFVKLRTHIHTKENQNQRSIPHPLPIAPRIHTNSRSVKSSFKTNNHSSTTTNKSTESQNVLSVNPPSNKFLSSDVATDSKTETRTKEPIPQTNTTPEKTKDAERTKQDSITANENNPDSALVNSLPDSTDLIVPEKIGPNKGEDRWSLAVLAYWEGEKTRPVDFRNEPFENQRRETARIHASTFYEKIEINRRFAERWEILTGIGFRSSKIVQYGYLERIETPVGDLSSGGTQPITSPIPDTIQWSEVQSFRTNSIVLPIGLAYSFPIGNKLQLRLSGGGEFAYGQITTRQSHPDLSAPKFNPFGFNVWFRPEIHYSFGRTQVFGFGTFNQALSQQLKWDFEPRRNPAFGTGIGLRIGL